MKLLALLVIKSQISPTIPSPIPGPRSVELLVIGGGGSQQGSVTGGGAGGVKYYGPTPTPVRVSPNYTIPTSSIAVYVGEGGGYQLNGNPSYFDTVVSTGGGKGTQPGGSGGGGISPLGVGGTGIPGQGFPGSSASPYAGGGGGGATAAGGAPAPNSGPGGNGVQLTMFNPFGVPAPPGANWFAGGGAGSSTPANFGNSQQGTGGFGGGGFCNMPPGGGPNDYFPGNPGATNTGAGGGGSHSGAAPDSGNGGPGIIIIRY